MKTTLLWVAAGSAVLALSLGSHHRQAPRLQPRESTEDMAETMASHGIELSPAPAAPDAGPAPVAWVQPAPQ